MLLGLSLLLITAVALECGYRCHLKVNGVHEVFADGEGVSVNETAAGFTVPAGATIEAECRAAALIGRAWGYLVDA